MRARLQLVQGWILSHLTLRLRQVTHDLGLRARPWASTVGFWEEASFAPAGGGGESAVWAGALEESLA